MKTNPPIYYKRRIPHYQPQGGSIFVTFRLNFPVPRKFLIDYNLYKAQLIKDSENKDEQVRGDYISKNLFSYVDDRYNGCHSDISITDNPNVATIIYDKILEMQEAYYYLYTFTLMPNPLHMLIKPTKIDGEYAKLNDIIRLLKGSTSRRVNQLLDRKGSFWAREYHDRWVRTQKELFNIIEYIKQNPVKARLVKEANDWKWTWVNPEYLVC